MVNRIGYIMFGIGASSLLAAGFMNFGSALFGATANVIGSNAAAFSYVEAILFSIAAVSLMMGIVFLKHPRRN